jgi:hypothetical protein
VHSVFTIVADVSVGQVGALEDVLRQIEWDHGRNPHIQFRRFPTLHFASFVIFDRDTAPFLVFENSVDGPIAAYLDELMATSAAGIDAIYQHCADYPLTGAPHDRRAFLACKLRKPQLYHCGTAYRTVASIKADAALHSRVAQRLDALVSGALPMQLETTPPVLPSAPEHPVLHALAVLAGAAAMIGVLVWKFWSTLPRLSAALSIAIAVVAAIVASDRTRIARLAAIVGATADVTSPRWLWEQLRQSAQIEPHRERRLGERVRNWSVIVALWVVTAFAFAGLWDRHWALLTIVTVAFTFKAYWLSMIVGWPTPDGNWRPVLWFVPAAAFGGAIFCVLRWHPGLSLALSEFLLGGLALFIVARALSVHSATDASGNWRVLAFLVLAAAAGWWFFHITGSALVATLMFPPAFVALIFASAVRLRQTSPYRVPFWAFVIGGGVGAGGFWLFTGRPAWVWIRSAVSFPLPGPGVWWFALFTLAALLYLWLVPLPMPTTKPPVISRAKLRALSRREDIDVQNHMSALVLVRTDHRARALLLRAFLWTLNHIFFRTVLPDVLGSTLFGIPTVHFAQWVLLDERRFLFLSNYDLTWTVYLDDFGSRITTGIQKIWGQGEGNPSVTNLTRFKQYARSTMVPHQVWYRAYPGLTSEHIHNNEAIRVGLQSSADEEQSLALLRRLAGVEG